MVGRLVKQQHVRTGHQRARERRPGEFTAQKHGQRIRQACVGDAETAGDAGHPASPLVSAGPFEHRVRALVGPENLRGRVTGLHPGLELGQLEFCGDGVSHPLGDVLLQRAPCDLERRPLVMQRNARTSRQADTPAIGRQLPGDDPQQRGLALAVAPDDRQAVSRRDTERDLVQDLSRTEALGELNDFHKRVG